MHGGQLLAPLIDKHVDNVVLLFNIFNNINIYLNNNLNQVEEVALYMLRLLSYCTAGAVSRPRTLRTHASGKYTIT